MAITRRQVGTATAPYTADSATFTTTTLAVSLPGVALAGSMLVAGLQVDKNASTFSVPSGWTALASVPGTSVSLLLLYKAAAGGEQALTFTWGAPSQGAQAFIVEYQGVALANPFGPNNQVPVYSDTSRTSLAFPAAGPATANGLALAVLGIDSTGTTGVGGFNPTAAGYTSAAHAYNSGANSGTNNSGSGAGAIRLLEGAVASGSSPAPTFTWTDSDQVAGALVLMREAAAYPAAVYADGPAGYWRLGESSGTAAIDVIAGRTGTYGQGPLLAQAGLLTTDTDTAVKFDGVNDYITVAGTTAFNGGTAVSLEAWIKPTTIPASFATVVNRQNTYGIQFNGGKLEFYVTIAGAKARATTNLALVAGQVYHVVGTYDGANVRCYINGTLQTPITATTGPADVNGPPPLTVGSWDGTSEFANALIDEVAVYTKVLTADQVANHYALGAGQFNEAFSGANGAAWSTGWATDTGFSTIQSNQGQVKSAATASSLNGGVRTLPWTPGEFVTTVTAPAGTVEQYSIATLYSSANASAYSVGTDAYQFQIAWQGTPTLGIWRRKSNTVTKLQDVALSAAITSYKVRGKIVGNTLYAKAWDAAGSEPASWQLTVTDASPLSASNRVGLYAMNGADAVQRTQTFDDLNVTAAATAGGVQYVSASTVTSGSSIDTVTLPAPASLVSGNLLLATVEYAAAPSISAATAPAGWTLVASSPNTAAGESSSQRGTTYVFQKIAGGSEPASYAFSLTGANNASYLSGAIVQYSGVDPTTPTSGASSASQAPGTTKTAPTPPGPAGRTVVAVFGSWTSLQQTPGSGLTERAQPFAGSTGVLVADGLLGTASLTATTAASDSGSAISFVLTPSGATPAAAVPTLTSRIVGIPSTTAVSISTRTVNAANVRIKVGTDPQVTANVVYSSLVVPNAQGDAVHSITGLTTSTRQFYYRVEMTATGGSPLLDTAAVAGKFRTQPTGASSFNFVFGSCSNDTDPLSYSAMAGRGDDLFFQIGDFYYADGSGTDITNFRTKMAGKIGQPNHQKLLPTTPSLYTPSDHDGMNNDGAFGSDNTAWTNWNQVRREMWPAQSGMPATTGVYFTFVWGRVRFIVLDDRSFKSAPSATDNVTKTALGATQKQWLKDTITAATEPAIVLVQSGPWQGTAAGDAGWAGYTTERTELVNFFAASGKRLLLLAGDMHALAADDGSNMPGNIPVFHAAPLGHSSSIKFPPYSQGPYPASSGQQVQQYGRVQVVDDGVTITMNFTGYSADDTPRLSMSVSTTPALTVGKLKRYNGSAWVATPVKVWTGTAWVAKPIKRYNAATQTWVPIKST